MEQEREREGKLRDIAASLTQPRVRRSKPRTSEPTRDVVDAVNNTHQDKLVRFVVDKLILIPLFLRNSFKKLFVFSGGHVKILNKATSINYFPQSLKMVKIIPIYKKSYFLCTFWIQLLHLNTYAIKNFLSDVNFNFDFI